MNGSGISRRNTLKAGVAAVTGLTLGRGAITVASAADMLPLITKAVPSSGEQLPVIGVGTNAFGVNDADALAQLREVLRQLPDLGGKIVDTARIYGSSEEVIGSIVESLGNRDKLFLATKTPMNGDLSDIAGAVDLAFTRMKVKKLDLIQVHNFYGTDQFVAEFRKRKDAGQVRYMGVSTSTDNQYDQLADAMRKYPLDFIQVDYSIDNRSAADNILPLAQERGIAVLVNMPFGGRRNAASTFSKVAKRELPDWAGEIDATSWAQVFLKYCVSHPSVTAAIPGTTKPHHLLDNQGGARGRLPDAAMRKEIEKYWDSL